MSTFAVVNLRGGQQRDVESFLLNNDAFPVLENAYLFRGRIERRSGTQPVGVDGILKGQPNTAATTFATDGAGNFGPGILLDGTTSGGIPVGVARFKVGNTTFTDPGGASPVNLLVNGTGTATLNRATGALTIVGSEATQNIIYLPGIPVMGLRTWEQTTVNEERLMAFDTRYTYLFDEGSNDFVMQNTFRGTTNTFVWTGANSGSTQDSDFIWSTNYFQAFWATNNVAGFHAVVNASPVAERDGIRWYVADSGGTGWSNFNPAVDGTNFLNGCLMLLPYKGRLIAFNTLEGANLAGTTRFAQRARWCQIGTPFYTNAPSGVGTDAAAWRSDQVGKGGFIDAPTQEAIVSAEFIKDTLVVYFERSTWQLVYTYNETLPFVWQKINTELGAESTFSVVPFDDGIVTVGNYGITACNSTNVVRIDQKIPDEVFRIQNKNSGIKRVHGIRDYNAQLSYWTYPVLLDDDDEAPNYSLIYPNQVLVYNYLDGSWAQFDDCFTCFGYWQKTTDVTWASLTRSWESTNVTWDSAALQARYPDVIAGNQRGFVGVFSQLALVGQNMPSLPIANITPGATTTITCTNHNLVAFARGQYVYITGVQGTTGLNGNIYKIDSTNSNGNSFTIITNPASSGTYTGGGLITHMPNIFIQTKQFNPFYESGKSLTCKQVDLFMDRTTDGEITTQLFVSDNTSDPVNEFVVLTSAETTFQATQNKVWHRMFANFFGSYIQLILTMSDSQMRSLDVTTSDITIQGLIFYVDQAGREVYEF